MLKIMEGELAVALRGGNWVYGLMNVGQSFGRRTEDNRRKIGHSTSVLRHAAKLVTGKTAMLLS